MLVKRFLLSVQHKKAKERKNRENGSTTESKVAVVKVFIASVSLNFVFFFLCELFITP